MVQTKTKSIATKGEISSERILETAFQLFISQGFHGTPMRQIAREASMTPASLYIHFENKEEIFHQVILRYHPYREIIPALEAATGENVESLVRDAAKGVFNVIRSRPELLHLFFSEAMEFEGRHLPEIIQLVYPQVQAFLTRLTKTKGHLRPLPPTSILFSLMGLVMSQWMMEAIFFKNAPIPVSPRQFEHAIDIYLHGIIAD